MNEDTVQHIGSGVLIQHNEHEYVVTALHVAKPCSFQPLIDHQGGWQQSTWQTIGIDEKNDVAVLERVGDNDRKIAALTLGYGFEGVVFGGTANAFGFPGTTPPIEWSRQEGQRRPVPMSVLVSIYPALGDTHYSGGYLNYGFSGGGIVAWAGTHPTLIGIITRKALTAGKNSLEHAGLVGYASIKVVERILAAHTGESIEAFLAVKPSMASSEASIPTPSSLMMGEVVDAIIMLGGLA